ncbi:hypothetical protein [Nocardia suismassiliense]|uniref:hypothetical protein n=1 Tax=Nocardia suismassiliense TaxID=2077092 RepID=UPI00131F43CD|nr:hypothetical protein [Nocardia suismassiliense]
MTLVQNLFDTGAPRAAIVDLLAAPRRRAGRATVTGRFRGAALPWSGALHGWPARP